MAISGVYQITNQVNGKHYIGSAVNLKRRHTQHQSALRHGRHKNPHLQAAWHKYGESAFGFTVLEYVEDSALLIPREQHFFDMLNPEYNIAPNAGSNLGRRFSAEIRKKVSEAHKGLHRSEEHCTKLSEANRGRHHSAETRRKMSKARRGERHHNYGKRLSEETRKRISQARKGYQFSAEHRRKVSEAKVGTHPTEETRRRMSEAHIGLQRSEEHCRKLSEAKTAYWRRIRAEHQDDEPM